MTGSSDRKQTRAACANSSMSAARRSQWNARTCGKSSRRRDATTGRIGVTGILLYDAMRFLQVIEGDADRIDLLLNTLGRDTRHADLEVLLDRSLDAREFGDWSMGGHLLGSGLPEEFATLDYRVKRCLAASKADGDLARQLLLELRSVRDSFVESAAR
ncbi:MAG: hypothetical protein CMD83_00495 [Gammaproteobacteria bacterium]|nr:hypothetical protein [Gammaproteobacteria bacterium]